MPKSAMIIVVGALLAVVVLALMVQALFLVERLVTVDQVSGRAEYWSRGGSQHQPAKEGALLRVGDTIRTGKQAFVGLRWVDGSRIKVGPETTLVLQRSRADKLRKTEQTRVRVNWGQVWLRVKRVIRAGSKFEVETPAVVAAVRGTVFAVAVAADGTTAVSVLEGSVELQGEGAERVVPEQMTALVAADGKEIRTGAMTGTELAAWSQQTGVVGPLLVVTEPAGEKVQAAEPYLEVVGKTEPEIKVTVGGKQALVDRQGLFMAKAPLQEGENEVAVVARDAQGRESLVKLLVSYESPAAQGAASCSVLSLPPSGQQATVSAALQDAQGRPVPDGTPVLFTTTAGGITELGRTTGGVATATFTSPDQPANITISARSGKATCSVGVTVQLTPGEAASAPAEGTAAPAPEQKPEGTSQEQPREAPAAETNTGQ